MSDRRDGPAAETAELETDVLVMGGGIAGCSAAIQAAELGAKVLVAEKGNTKRSGGATTGIDHCWAYIPSIHGPEYTIDDLVADHIRFTEGFIRPDLIRYIASRSYERIRFLESIGLPMRDQNGNYRLVKKIHRVPTFVHFAGLNLKRALTNRARKNRVHIMNRLMIIDILVEDGEAIGALGVHTRTEQLVVIRAKAVVIATGGVFRLYKNPTGLLFNTGFPGGNTGDGHAVALRAGAELLNMEFTTFQTGPKNFQRNGRGTYVPGIVRNALGEPLDSRYRGHNVLDAPPHLRSILTMTGTVEDALAYISEVQSGRGPLYMDCTMDTREQIEYIRWALRNEGNAPFLDYLDEQRIDLSRDLIEFGLYEAKLSEGHAGVSINTRCETRVPGLYAAGDVLGGVKRSVCPGALSLGALAGEEAAARARSISTPELGPDARRAVAAHRELIRKMLQDGPGARWQEALIALQNVMDHYCGMVRSETMLRAGLSHLRQLRAAAREELRARNFHEVYRAHEVLNLFDVGEAVMTAARARTESRFVPSHYRADFPQQDDANWRRFVLVRRTESGALATALEDIRQEGEAACLR